MTIPDRRNTLLTDHSVVGIDFVFVHDDTQTVIDVHFISDPTPAVQALLTADRVSIVAAAGDAPAVPVKAVSFPLVGGDRVMRIETVYPGTFARYTLAIANPAVGAQAIDPYLSRVVFSFKAGCHSDLDCDESPAPCPPETPVDFPVDYQARDFWSLRTALLDFASQRYPDWADRLEADAGVMLAEAMSALGDEFSYYQDRVAREAYLETATQRRSLRRHTRLVDYDIHDGLGASTWIDVTAKANGNLAAGTNVFALRDGRKVVYSIGRNLDEIIAGQLYPVALGLNDAMLVPYRWDVHDTCLPVGTTELYIFGDVTAALLPFNDVPGNGAPGRWLLLRTDPADPSLPARRHLVRVVSATVVHDPLQNQDTTRIVWESAQALPFQLDLTLLHVRGNLLPAVAGQKVEQIFVIGPGGEALPPDSGDPWAVERLGANGVVTYLFSLAVTDVDGLVRRADPAAPSDPHLAAPEIRLVEIDAVGKEGDLWHWRRAFLGVTSSQSFDRHFELEDGFYRRIVGYRTEQGPFAHIDYAQNDGATICFGDNVFGLSPPPGKRFKVDYLVGNGKRANLPPAAITSFDPTDPTLSLLVSAVENPFAVTNGVDPEDAGAIRQLAPEAFRAVTYRAVRPEDYAEAAERLDWIQRAGCTFRWTGSWQTAFVADDPLGGIQASDTQRTQLARQLDHFRQAGREVVVRDPRYADLDLKIHFCVKPNAYPAEVVVRVLAALTGSAGAFFSDDNFTFGTPLDRTRLEAAIQDVAGVRAVEQIFFRRRGLFGWKAFTALAYRAAPHEVFRVENDPLHPDRGSIQLIPDGGA